MNERTARLSSGRVGRRRWWRYLLVALVVAIVVGNAIYQQQRPAPPDTRPRPSASPEAAPSGAAGSALAALDTLTVADAGTSAGYDRDRFGSAWADVDDNGCDTRNDILARDLTDLAYDGASDCVVLTGTFDDPYTGTVIAFQRGNATSAKVQIDHVVPLLDAWLKGASSWDRATRTAFANDPLNLLASDGSSNQSKGARDASVWLPPNEAFHCPYVARQIAVKDRYDVAVTPAEADAMRAVLAGCPDEPLPVG